MKQTVSLLGKCLPPIVVGLVMFAIMVYIGSCGEDVDEPTPKAPVLHRDLSGHPP